MSQGDGIEEHPTFINALGCTFSFWGEAPPSAQLVVSRPLLTPCGHVRASVLATVSDVLAGIPAVPLFEGLMPVTTDLSLRQTGRPASGVLRGEAEVLRAGRRRSVLGCSWRNEAGALVADAVLTFVALPGSSDIVVHRPTITPTTVLQRALPEALGVEVLEPGMACFDLRPDLVQLSGTAQGGALAVLAEAAAESLAVTGESVDGLDIRYLGPIRERAVARAEHLGGGHVRISITGATATRAAVVAWARLSGR